MLKRFKKRGFIAVLICLVFVAGFYLYLFNIDFSKAQGSPIQFVSDVKLDLTGLTSDVYINGDLTGSQCNSLIVSGANLTVNGIPSGNPFTLENASDAILLRLTPSAGVTADFSLSSANFSEGYISQWNTTSAVSVNYLVGVPLANTDYAVNVGGVQIPDSPFNSGSSAQISFSYTGAGVFTIETPPPPPCQYHNVWGWAWSSNIGWMSFSCRDTMNLGEGVDYGVDIDPATGNFSGYAYFDINDPNTGVDEIGWIWFAPTDIPPGEAGPNPARLNLLVTNEVSGWARACNVFQTGCSGALKPNSERGGWDGWIKLRGMLQDGVTPYGVSLDTNSTPAEFTDWAWGGNETNGDANNKAVIGWISFNRLNCDTDGDGTYEGAGEAGGSAPANCPTSGTAYDYKVMADFNPAPTVTPNAPVITSGCGSNPIMKFNWDFNDPGDSQSSYEIQIDDDSTREEPTEPIPPFSTSGGSNNFGEHAGLSYNTQYWWWVRVQDSGGKWSGWTAGPSSFNPSLGWPNPIFTSSSSNPRVGEVVTFTDSSQCYTGVANCKDDVDTSYLWDFGDFTTSSIKGNATHDYSIIGSKTVRLEVTDQIDGIGRMCLTQTTLGVRLPLPRWWEIPPF